MNKKVDRGRTTRGQLVAVATRLFAEHGYDGTSVDAVLQHSGVSRGALYHHFSTKEALFDAVLESVEADIAEKIQAASAAHDDPVDALRAGCVTWVHLAGHPVVQRIVLLDAPAVLGWQRWREIEERHAFGMLKAALRPIASAGRLPARLLDPIAHMLLAALNEMALLIARAKDEKEAARTSEEAVDELLKRLLRP